jgi:hypothetical protein
VAKTDTRETAGAYYFTLAQQPERTLTLASRRAAMLLSTFDDGARKGVRAWERVPVRILLTSE